MRKIRNVQSTVVGKRQGNNSYGRPRSRWWKHNIKMDYRLSRWEMGGVFSGSCQVAGFVISGVEQSKLLSCSSEGSFNFAFVVAHK
jgi:hypothetical protein